MPVPVDRAEGGEVAPVDLLTATGRDEGVVTPDGTEVAMGAGTAAVRRGRNSDQSIKRVSYALFKDCCVLFLVFFLTCPRLVPVPTDGRFVFSFFLVR